MSWNLNENFANSVKKSPEHSAFVYLGQSTTYSELGDQVQRVAFGLSQRGIKKGDKVALLLGNSPEFIIAYYGILRLGAIVVPINPTFTAPEISYILANSEAKGVVALSALSPLMDVLKEKISLSFVVYVGEYTTDINWTELIAADAKNESVFVDEEDLAVILYTSGTTGRPKGAMLTHKNMASNAEGIQKLVTLTPEDRMVAVLPMFHVFCMTVCMNGPIAAGSTIIIIPRFSPVEVLETIHKEGATILAAVPTMFNFLYQVPNTVAENFSSIRYCCSGGASLPVDLLHRFEKKFNTIILEGYGLSESSPIATFNTPRKPRKAGSIGVDIFGVTNKVVDENGNELPPNEIGELIVQGPNIMKGYLGMPEATAEALKDGWLYTGDMAYMDEEGYFYIVDRKKDLIIVGGYNVYPREVEEVLYKHPDIIEAAVIGVPHEEYGESVKAFVVAKDPTLTSEAVIEFCREQLVRYKLPRTVEFLADLPKNSTGKILRRSLREEVSAN